MHFQGSPRLPLAAHSGLFRRATPRHMPVERQAWIAWRAGCTADRVPALLLDISRGGAAVEVDREIQEDQLLQFGLAGAPSAEGILEAKIVRSVTTRSGGHRLHLAFATTCPDDLLKRALFGTRAPARLPLLDRVFSFMKAFTNNPRSACRDAR